MGREELRKGILKIMDETLPSEEEIKEGNYSALYVSQCMRIYSSLSSLLFEEACYEEEPLREVIEEDMDIEWIWEGNNSPKETGKMSDLEFLYDLKERFDKFHQQITSVLDYEILELELVRDCKYYNWDSKGMEEYCDEKGHIQSTWGSKDCIDCNLREWKD